MGARKQGPVYTEPRAQYGHDQYLLIQLPDQPLIFKMRRQAQRGCDVSKVTEQVSDHQGRALASWTQPVLCPHTLPAHQKGCCSPCFTAPTALA